MRWIPQTKRGLGKVWLVVVLATATLAVGVGMVWSKGYWGYFVSRTGEARAVRQATQLHSLTRYDPASWQPNGAAATDIVPRSATEAIKLPKGGDSYSVSSCASKRP